MKTPDVDRRDVAAAVNAVTTILETNCEALARTIRQFPPGVRAEVIRALEGRA